MLDSNPLSVISFADIFSHSVGRLFILFMVSFAVQKLLFIFKNKFIYFIYLFLAALGLCCCTRAFSGCSEWGLLFVVVRRLLVVASLVVEHRL